MTLSSAASHCKTVDVSPALDSSSTPALSESTAMLPSVDGFELVKFSVSPLTYPEAIVTEAVCGVEESDDREPGVEGDSGATSGERHRHPSRR